MKKQPPLPLTFENEKCHNCGKPWEEFQMPSMWHTTPDGKGCFHCHECMKIDCGGLIAWPKK